MESRLEAIAARHWIELIDASGEMCWKAKEAMVRRNRRQGSVDMKVARAQRLAMMGELSAARQVLESADVAPFFCPATAPRGAERALIDLCFEPLPFPKKCQSEEEPPPPEMSMTIDLPECQERRRGKHNTTWSVFFL